MRPREEKMYRPRLYLIYLLTVCLSVAMVIVVILDFPILSFLPSSNQPASSKFLVSSSLPLICIIFAVSLFYAWNLSAASDLVPSMIYYHLAVELEQIAKLLQESSLYNVDPVSNVHSTELSTFIQMQPCDANDVHKIWFYYEAVRSLVDETNTVFGLMVLLNHGAMFFVASSNVFAILRWYQGMSWLLLLVNGSNAASTILRVSTTILLCSRLSKAGEQLQTHISRHLAGSWFRMEPTNDRQFYLATFLIRVQDKGTVASPFGLYPIKSSMLLTMWSLLVTYLIVLLQSSEMNSFAAYANFTGLITGSYFYDLSHMD